MVANAYALRGYYYYYTILVASGAFSVANPFLSDNYSASKVFDVARLTLPNRLHILSLLAISQNVYVV